MAENPFRILLDLRELNFRFYKFVWMSISPRELVTIRDLKDSIVRKFSFERNDLLLFLRDGLLPEDENITNILRENDSVRLFYAEPTNLNDSRTINHEEAEQNIRVNDKVKSVETHEIYSDLLEDDNEVEKPNKKRKCSFLNGTYVFENNSTPENYIVVNAVPNDAENISNADLNNVETRKHRKSYKVKKKLKYSNGVSENDIFLASDTFPMLEKSQSKVNSCKKKKKHKHSKDFKINSGSKNEIDFHDIVAASNINKNENIICKKKKKYKNSLDDSKMNLLSETAVSFCDKISDSPEKVDSSVQDLEAVNEQSVPKESIFETVTDDSKVLKPTPVLFGASSASTSSGIGYSLRTSEENNQKISLEQNHSNSYVSDDQPALETNLSFNQGNNCKKKKRRRHKKRKPLSTSFQIDESDYWNLDASSRKDDNQFMKDTSEAYQTAEISPGNNETSNSSKLNTFLFRKDPNCSEKKGGFLKPFSMYLPTTSTPFTIAQNPSPKNKLISKMESSSNSSQNQSCSVTTSQKTILPAIPQKTNEMYPSIQSPFCSVIKDKDNAAVSNHDIHEKSLSGKIKDSSLNTSASPSKLEINSRFLDPNFSYKGCPTLDSCPLPGTHIAYKVLELDESYSPIVSNYKEGMVTAVNSQTDELEIELIEPEIKQGRSGKFEILYEDELPSCEVIRKVMLSWPSLIDPVRVIY